MLPNFNLFQLRSLSTNVGLQTLACFQFSPKEWVLTLASAGTSDIFDQNFFTFSNGVPPSSGNTSRSYRVVIAVLALMLEQSDRLAIVQWLAVTKPAGASKKLLTFVTKSIQKQLIAG